MKTVDQSNFAEKFCWIMVLLWVLTIYGTSAFVYNIVVFMIQNTPFGPITLLAVSAGLAFLAALAMHRLDLHNPWMYVCIGALVGLYVCALNLIRFPAERIHLIEYGLLAFLIWRALRFRCSLRVALPAAFGITIALGWIDEVIQYFEPSRHYQNSDVVLNAVSAVLALCWVVIFSRFRKEA